MSNGHTANMSAYNKVEETIIHQLTNGRWFAAVRCRVKKSGVGYDIGPFEDLHRNFDNKEDAEEWVKKKVEAIERP